MKFIPIVSLLALSSLSPLLGAEGWMTDFQAAKEKAAKEKKALLIDFTGSDWCGWCIKLSEEVFDHEEFSKGVADKFVLVELDFPRDKSKMDEATIMQNEKLQEEYAIEGFPTIYLTDHEGKPFGKTGYQEGGPAAYLTHLAMFEEKLAERDAALAKAAKAEGKERAAALDAALAAVPQESIAKFYAAELEELAKLDPESATVVAIKKAEAAGAQDKKFGELFEAEKFAEVIALAESLIKEQKPEGVEHQQLLAYQVNAYMAQEDFDGAIKVLDAVIAVDATTEFGQGAGQFKKQLLQRKQEMEDASGEEKEEEAEKPAEEAPAPADGARNTPRAAADQGVASISIASSAVVLISTQEGEARKDQRAAQAEARKKKEECGKEEAAKHATAAGDGASDEKLRQALDKARASHREIVAKVNGSHEYFEKMGAELPAKRKRVAELTAALAEATKDVRATEMKLAEIEKAHHAAHAEQEALEKTVAGLEKELQRRTMITDLEKEARELHEKAEMLRKKAEELKR